TSNLTDPAPNTVRRSHLRWDRDGSSSTCARSSQDMLVDTRGDPTCTPGTACRRPSGMTLEANACREPPYAEGISVAGPQEARPEVLSRRVRLRPRRSSRLRAFLRPPRFER